MRQKTDIQDNDKETKIYQETNQTSKLPLTFNWTHKESTLTQVKTYKTKSEIQFKNDLMGWLFFYFYFFFVLPKFLFYKN